MEWVEPSPAANPEAQPPAVRDVKIGSIVETFRVDDHGKKYEVAATAVANRALMQINVGKLRALWTKTADSLDGITLPPKELKLLVDAAVMIENMSSIAYGDSKAHGKLGNSLERLAYAFASGAVEAGAKLNGSHSPEARLNRLKKLGKRDRPKEAEPIDIEPKK